LFWELREKEIDDEVLQEIRGVHARTESEERITRGWIQEAQEDTEEM
jgi:hypothetical protein